MSNKAFEVARSAMTSLELFRDTYASGEPYQEHFQKVLVIIRAAAENSSGQHGDKKFLLAFADALETANKPGEYVPLSQR